MRSRIRKCRKCNLFSLRDKCPECGSTTENTFPPRYSPQDKYGRYRRMYYKDTNEESQDQ
ncbi:MAG: RNA-protein complex protein Nop10 [Candidatus Thermoplasmatota archaeon]|nr:RNA-protein complex protein Nop10 [Candidatus Thermoplasmatota archaeon]